MKELIEKIQHLNPNMQVYYPDGATGNVLDVVVGLIKEHCEGKVLISEELSHEEKLSIRNAIGSDSGFYPSVKQVEFYQKALIAASQEG